MLIKDNKIHYFVYYKTILQRRLYPKNWKQFKIFFESYEFAGVRHGYIWLPWLRIIAVITATMYYLGYSIAKFMYALIFGRPSFFFPSV